MNIQIIGTKKCRDTKKAERFFKERRISFHFVDLNERALSPGEFNNIRSKSSAEDLLNTGSNAYKQGGFKYREFDIDEELFENQQLLKTPIIRLDKDVLVGFDQDQLKKYLC